MDRILLKNSIRLLIGGYLYDTTISDDIDEMEKIIDMPVLLKEIAEEYEEEIKHVEEALQNED